MCFSAINGSGPAYLSELLHVYTPSRTLCSYSDTRMLEIHTCQPIQFTCIKFLKIFIFGDMAMLENGYRKTSVS